MKIIDVDGDNGCANRSTLRERNTLLLRLPLRFCRVRVQCVRPADSKLKERPGRRPTLPLALRLVSNAAWSLALSLAFTICSDRTDDVSSVGALLLFLWPIVLLAKSSMLTWSSSSSCVTEPELLALELNFNLVLLWSSS